MTDNLNPLQYLEDIIFFDGLDIFMSTFLNNPKLLGEGYIYYEPKGTYDKFDLIELADSDDPTMTVTTIDRNSFLEQYLLESKKNLFKLLKIKEVESSFSSELFKLYNALNAMIKKQSISDSKYKEIIEIHLVKLVEDLRIQFPIIVNRQQKVY